MTPFLTFKLAIVGKITSSTPLWCRSALYSSSRGIFLERDIGASRDVENYACATLPKPCQKYRTSFQALYLSQNILHLKCLQGCQWLCHLDHHNFIPWRCCHWCFAVPFSTLELSRQWLLIVCDWTLQFTDREVIGQQFENTDVDRAVGSSWSEMHGECNKAKARKIQELWVILSTCSGVLLSELYRLHLAI